MALSIAHQKVQHLVVEKSSATSAGEYVPAYSRYLPSRRTAESSHGLYGVPKPHSPQIGNCCRRDKISGNINSVASVVLNLLPTLVDICVPHLYFMRTRAGSDCPYDEWTDVWVFGDLDGYMAAEQCFGEGVETRTPITMPSGPYTEHSMPVLLLPPVTCDETKARVRIGEFIVSQCDRLLFQIVIVANQSGYKYLAKEFRHARTRLDRDPLDHLHIDGPVLVQRSITLNIRGQLEPWSARGIKSYGACFEKPVVLPDGAEYMVMHPEDYLEFSLE